MFKYINKIFKLRLLALIMVKCSLCNKNIEELFLKKIKGTYIKKKPVCSDCQKKLKKEFKGRA